MLILSTVYYRRDREKEKATAIVQLRGQHTGQCKLQATEERLSNFGRRQTPARHGTITIRTRHTCHSLSFTYFSMPYGMRYENVAARALPHRAIATGITILLSSSCRGFRRTFRPLFLKHRTLSHNASRISMDAQKFAHGNAIFSRSPSLSVALAARLYLKSIKRRLQLPLELQLPISYPAFFRRITVTPARKRK